jgi:hypothetical protein
MDVDACQHKPQGLVGRAEAHHEQAGGEEGGEEAHRGEHHALAAMITEMAPIEGAEARENHVSLPDAVGRGWKDRGRPIQTGRETTR